MRIALLLLVVLCSIALSATAAPFNGRLAEVNIQLEGYRALPGILIENTYPGQEYPEETRRSMAALHDQGIRALREITLLNESKHAIALQIFVFRDEAARVAYLKRRYGYKDWEKDLFLDDRGDVVIYESKHQRRTGFAVENLWIVAQDNNPNMGYYGVALKQAVNALGVEFEGR